MGIQTVTFGIIFSVISNQLSVISYQLSVISGELSVESYQLSVESVIAVSFMVR
ncbi:hypothetical protein M8120_02710 [Microcystis aeruginosa str. Chao 1910]|uniref:hypothetical protein n=1 Tax=Microcystis aeruginosa TaxID=1126 RepID=UPI002247C045|nr:hypothetical protein [Microcystis aeruginosa]UZO76974.1 hypothetical protein M8120_02710 [Microcystis aeruginosa str. Chao 1910]